MNPTKKWKEQKKMKGNILRKISLYNPKMNTKKMARMNENVFSENKQKMVHNITATNC